MTERERLVTLLDEASKIAGQTVHKAIHSFVKENHHFSSKDDSDKVPSLHELVADYLLSHGVILSPVKVGDKVYYICEEFEEYGGNYVSELTITEVSNVRFWVENEDENHFRFADIGKTVFLTREEAEAALEKLRTEITDGEKNG